MKSTEVERVEVISWFLQRFKGTTYHRRSDDYFVDDWGKLLHRQVYKSYFHLDKEQVVHHIDGDRSNNQIENLEAMTQAEHVRLHRIWAR